MAKGPKTVLDKYDGLFKTADESQDHIYFSTGLVGLDYAIGNLAGIQGGTMMQILGEKSSGKSSLSLGIIAQAQQEGNLQQIEMQIGKETKVIDTVYLDFELSYDPQYAATLGVDNSRVLLIKPTTGEEGFELTMILMKAGIQLVIVDSIPMFIPAADRDKDLDEGSKVAGQAAVLGNALKRMHLLANNNDALVILINQYRSNLSPMARTNKQPFGARIIQYVVKLTVELTRIETKNGRGKTKIAISKNKLPNAIEGKVIEADITFGGGFDYAGHVVELGITYGIVKKQGSWYSFGDKKGQGIPGSCKVFDLVALQQAVLDVLSIGVLPEEENTQEGEV